jgi:hypothetical protein
MKSKDPLYQRDRDQWPLFRTRSARALMRKVVSFVDYVRRRGSRPVVCFYFHPWEFEEMPQAGLSFGEAVVRPMPFLVRNCGRKAVQEFDSLCGMLRDKGARFLTARAVAAEYR